MSFIYDEGMARMWRAVIISALRKGLSVRGDTWDKETKLKFKKHTAVHVNKAGVEDINNSREFLFSAGLRGMSPLIGLNMSRVLTLYREMLTLTIEAEKEPSLTKLDLIKKKKQLFNLNKHKTGV